jgi:crotonobetainyl-CoA:carnitine CoA-transferase CaiB-like acyl-CoA transferase
LLALMDRTKNGTAKTVEVSLYDAAVCSLMNQASNYLMSGKIPERMGSLHPNIAPYGELFETKDGQLITFAIGSNLHFSKLCRFLELDLVLKDIRFIDNQQRVIHRGELQKLINEKVSQRTSEQIITALRAEKVPYGIVKNIDEVLSSAASKKMIKTENINAKATKRMSQIAFKWK